MSDTVAVALIAVAGTLGSGGLSYFAARRSTQVQLAAVNVEMERLHRTHAEEARQERQRLYQDYLETVESMENLVRGLRGPLTREAFMDASNAVSAGLIKMMLLADKEVLPAAEELGRAVAEFSEAAVELAEEGEERSREEIMRIALDRTSEKWHAARDRLLKAMRADIGTSSSLEGVKSVAL